MLLSCFHHHMQQYGLATMVLCLLTSQNNVCCNIIFSFYVNSMLIDTTSWKKQNTFELYIKNVLSIYYILYHHVVLSDIGVRVNITHFWIITFLWPIFLSTTVL